MEKDKDRPGSADADFLDKIRELPPVAHGTLSLVHKRCTSRYCRTCKSGSGHPAWIFTYRKDGASKCLHIQPRHVGTVRQAIENGRRLEEAILDEGIALIRRLREQG